MDKKGSFIHNENGLMTMTSIYPLHSQGRLCFQGRGNVIKTDYYYIQKGSLLSNWPFDDENQGGQRSSTLESVRTFSYVKWSNLLQQGLMTSKRQAQKDLQKYFLKIIITIFR